MGPVSPVMKLSPKDGEVVEVRCHHVPDSVGKNPPGVKVSGVIHWVPATQSVPGRSSPLRPPVRERATRTTALATSSTPTRWRW